MNRGGNGAQPGESIAFDALSLLSKKWNPIVLVALDYHGPMGFNDLLEEIPDISGKVLTRALESLQDAGLVERRVLRESPLRVEYELTDAGSDMDSIFDALTEWGERHLVSSSATILLAVADRRLSELYAEWLTDRYSVLLAHDEPELASSLDSDPDAVIVGNEVPWLDPGDVIDTVGSACRIILLVGDRPGFEVLEIDCDDVLRKPLVRTELLEAVDDQLTQQGDAQTQPPREYGGLIAKRTLFDSIYTQDALRTNTAYAELCSRLEAFQEHPAD